MTMMHPIVKSWFSLAAQEGLQRWGPEQASMLLPASVPGMGVPFSRLPRRFRVLEPAHTTALWCGCIEVVEWALRIRTCTWACILCLGMLRAGTFVLWAFDLFCYSSVAITWLLLPSLLRQWSHFERRLMHSEACDVQHSLAEVYLFCMQARHFGSETQIGHCMLQMWSKCGIRNASIIIDTNLQLSRFHLARGFRQGKRLAHGRPHGHPHVHPHVHAHVHPHARAYVHPHKHTYIGPYTPK